jgi:hypothetical protein
MFDEKRRPYTQRKSHIMRLAFPHALKEVPMKKILALFSWLFCGDYLNSNGPDFSGPFVVTYGMKA